MKAIGEELGFTGDMKAYKASPESFAGSVSDVAEVLRVAVTGHANSPDLCTIMRILGKETCKERLNLALAAIPVLL